MKRRAVISTSAQLESWYRQMVSSFEGGWPPQPLLITVTAWRPPKTVSQNAYMHVAIRELADHVGYGEEEMKTYLKGEFGPRKIIEINGKIHAIPKSMTDYTREEASDMIEQIHRIGAEVGAIIGSSEHG